MPAVIVQETGAGFLAGTRGGGWLPLDPTVELFGCYGVPLAESVPTFGGCPDRPAIEGYR